MKTPPVLLPFLLVLATLLGHAHANNKKQHKKILRPPGTGILEYFQLKGEDKDKDGQDQLKGPGGTVKAGRPPRELRATTRHCRPQGEGQTTGIPSQGEGETEDQDPQHPHLRGNQTAQGPRPLHQEGRGLAPGPRPRAC